MDHYSTLGVPRSASQDEVKTAFRKLALVHHPDRLQGASEKAQQEGVKRFQAITEAYDILSDDIKRAEYRARMHSGVHSGMHSGTSTSRAASHASGTGTSYGYGSAQSTRTWDWQHASRQRSRVSLWQTITQSFSRRPLELAFFASLAGMAGVGVWGVDSLWHWRNQGRRFEDIQRKPTHSLLGLSHDQELAAAAAAAVPADRNAARSYTPSGCGSRTRYNPPSQQQGGPSQEAAAAMPLSKLIQLEEEATAAAANKPVDRAHIFRVSPPGQMRGHTPAATHSGG